MEGVKLEGLTLHVTDANRSVEFYNKVPGAELVMQFGEPFAMFKFGQGRLGLLKADKPGFHIELVAEKRLDEISEAVLAAGIETESPPTQRLFTAFLCAFVRPSCLCGCIPASSIQYPRPAIPHRESRIAYLASTTHHSPPTPVSVD